MHIKEYVDNTITVINTEHHCTWTTLLYAWS